MVKGKSILDRLGGKDIHFASNQPQAPPKKKSASSMPELKTDENPEPSSAPVAPVTEPKTDENPEPSSAPVAPEPESKTEVNPEPSSVPVAPVTESKTEVKPEPSSAPAAPVTEPKTEVKPKPGSAPAAPAPESKTEENPEPSSAPVAAVTEPKTDENPEPGSAPVAPVTEPKTEENPEPSSAPVAPAPEPKTEVNPEPSSAPVAPAPEPKTEVNPEPGSAPVAPAPEPKTEVNPEPSSAPVHVAAQTRKKTQQEKDMEAFTGKIRKAEESLISSHRFRDELIAAMAIYPFGIENSMLIALQVKCREKYNARSVTRLFTNNLLWQIGASVKAECVHNPIWLDGNADAREFTIPDCDKIETKGTEAARAPEQENGKETDSKPAPEKTFVPTKWYEISQTDAAEHISIKHTYTDPIAVCKVTMAMLDEVGILYSDSETGISYDPEKRKFIATKKPFEKREKLLYEAFKALAQQEMTLVYNLAITSRTRYIAEVAADVMLCSFIEKNWLNEGIHIPDELKSDEVEIIKAHLDCALKIARTKVEFIRNKLRSKKWKGGGVI